MSSPVIAETLSPAPSTEARQIPRLVHNPRVRLGSAPPYIAPVIPAAQPDTVTVTAQDFRDLLSKVTTLVNERSTAPSERTKQWVQESSSGASSHRGRPRQRPNRSKRHISSSSSSASPKPKHKRTPPRHSPSPRRVRSPRRERSPRPDRDHDQREPDQTRATDRERAPRYRSSERSSRDYRDERPDPYQFGNRYPMSGYSPNASYRHRGIYRPDHDADRMFYDRDLAQRDRAREHEAQARRDREQRRREPRPVSPVKPRPRTRSRSRYRSASPPKKTAEPVVKPAPLPPNTRQKSRDRDPDRASDSADSQESQEHQPSDHEGQESGDGQDPSAPDGGSLPYTERLDLTRNLFVTDPLMVENPPEQRKTLSCAGTGSRPVATKSLLSLPWHGLKSELAKINQERLLGQQSSTKAKDSGPLAMGRYLKRTEVKSSFYRITGLRAQQVARIPSAYHTLQSAQTEHLGIRLTAAEVEDLELAHRQSSAMLSHQDWLLGATRILLEQITAAPDKAAAVAPQAHSLLLSAARAGMDLQTVNTHGLHNVVLRRRDVFLASTNKALSVVAKKELRQHDLEDEFLFGPEACDKAHRTMLEKATLTAAVSGGKRSQPPPQAQSKPKSPPKKGNYQSSAPSTSNWSPPKPNQAKTSPRPWEKNKGRGSPRNSSSFKQGGGGRGRGGNRN